MAKSTSTIYKEWRRRRQSARPAPGDACRVLRSYRLHYDRITELEKMACRRGISKSRLLEELIRDENMRECA